MSEPTPALRLHLDWSAFDAYGQGDASDKGVMCPNFRITQDDLHRTRGRAGGSAHAGPVGTAP